MDRSYFKIKTFKEASNNSAYWLSKSPIERLHAAWKLTCHAYNIDYKDPPPMDRSYFEIRARD